ncbi:MAG TPA: hypothetical protein VF552_11375 [Allosphingosinicella sp.]|jgi:hypothetical protein
MADYSTCTDPTCGTTVEGRPPACPTCAKPMRRLGESKIRGGVLIATGLFLVLFPAWIWWYLWDMLRNPGVDFGGSRFTGTSGDAELIMLLFSALMLFGACGLAYGIYMVTTGRESSGFRNAIFALLGLLVAVGGVIRYGIGCGGNPC